jgi:dolichyl-phosphate-mannose-protein mannosyltransferase
MAKNAADKTNDMIEVNRLNSKISAEKVKITDYKNTIGEYYWAKYNSGDAIDPDAAKICEEIKNCQNIIEDLNQEIAKIKEDPENL